MTELFSSRLSMPSVDRAYPLVHLHRPKVMLEQWRTYAGNCLSGCGPDAQGFAIVEDHCRTIFGIAEFRVAADLVHGFVLKAENFMVASVVPPQERRVTAALIANLEKLASAHGCSAVVLGLPAAAGMRAPSLDLESLRWTGRQLANWVFHKPIA